MEGEIEVFIRILGRRDTEIAELIKAQCPGAVPIIGSCGECSAHGDAFHGNGEGFRTVTVKKRCIKLQSNGCIFFTDNLIFKAQLQIIRIGEEGYRQGVALAGRIRIGSLCCGGGNREGKVDIAVGGWGQLQTLQLISC